MTIRLNKAVKMSNDVDLGRIYKGEEYDVTIPIQFSGDVSEFQLYFYTDSAATIEIPLSRILIEDGYGTIHFQDDEFDPINDGVLKYYLKWSLDGREHITCTNTLHYLKTADGYNPRTVEEMVSEAYTSGITYQKSLLVSTAITDNGVYEREDGYSTVTVNVEEQQQDVDFLCFTAEEANSTVSLTIGQYISLNLYVSTDNQQTFTQWDGSEIVLHNIGDKVYMYGHNVQISFQHDSSRYCVFKLTGKIAASGNIESLLNRKGVDFVAAYCFDSLFSGCTSLTSAPQLPATNIGPHCYHQMFKGCTNITEAPVLPATTLAYSCYYSMFYGCISLTQAPLLPATKLAGRCYEYMFYNCSNITKAPELPATTLAEECYEYMFNGCTSLTVAPELLATTLASKCYMGMFNGCTSLNNIKCLATDISANNCTYGWLANVAANGTFTKSANMSSWTTGTSGIPSGWTVVND